MLSTIAALDATASGLRVSKSHISLGLKYASREVTLLAPCCTQFGYLPTPNYLHAINSCERVDLASIHSTYGMVKREDEGH